MKLQNKHLQPLIATIFAVRSDSQSKVTIGLLTEEMRMGLRHKLQDIRAELLNFLSLYESDMQKVEEAYKDKTAPEELEEKEKELSVIHEKTITLKTKPAKLSDIEEMVTRTNYNFFLIKLIAK